MRRLKDSCILIPDLSCLKEQWEAQASHSLQSVKPSERLEGLADQNLMYRGYECCIIMPDDVAIEKVQVLEKLGAKVERVRPGEFGSYRAVLTVASIVDEKQVGLE